MPGVKPSSDTELVLAELAVALLVLAVTPFEGEAGALLKLGGDLLVETLDPGQILEHDIGDLLERAEPFRDQQMGDHVVDVERVDKHLAAAAEFLGAPLQFLGLGQNVDVPAGELRGEAHILSAPADREASWSSGTTTSMRRCSSSITTLLTSAGASALTTNVAGSDDHGMMSIFSPCNSPTTA